MRCRSEIRKKEDKAERTIDKNAVEILLADFVTRNKAIEIKRTKCRQ
jgi:hypothetical protein